MKIYKLYVFKLYMLISLIAIEAHSAQAQRYGPIQSGEMLWNIAARVRADPSVSRHQVMFALLKANPQAFQVPCNMNSLKVNAWLTVPELTMIQAIPQHQALKAFEQQNQAWLAYQQHGKKIVCVLEEDQTDPLIKPISATTLLDLELLKQPIIEKQLPQPVIEVPEQPQAMLIQPSISEQPIHDKHLLFSWLPDQERLYRLAALISEFMTPLLATLAFLIGWLFHHLLGTQRNPAKTLPPPEPIESPPADEMEELSAKIEEKLAYVRSYLAENEDKAIETFLQEVLEKGSIEQQQQAQQLLAINRKMSTLELHLKKQQHGDEQLPQKYVLEDKDRIFKLVDKIFQLLDQEFQAQGKLLKIYTKHYRPTFFEDDDYKIAKQPHIVVEEDLESTLKQFRQQPPPTRHL